MARQQPCGITKRRYGVQRQNWQRNEGSRDAATKAKYDKEGTTTASAMRKRRRDSAACSVICVGATAPKATFYEDPESRIRRIAAERRVRVACGSAPVMAVQSAARNREACALRSNEAEVRVRGSQPRL